MRLFIAVFPPPDAQVAATRAADELRRLPGTRGVSWVKRDNLHFTLRFLGELDEVAVRRAEKATIEAVAEHRAFGASIGGFGAFPTAKKARVLWIGLLQGAEPMRRLADSLETVLRKRGFEPAEQAFEPHLTVGRLRDAADWTTRLIEAPSLDQRFQVDRLHVVSSSLTSKGSVYERVAEAPLGV